MFRLIKYFSISVGSIMFVHLIEPSFGILFQSTAFTGTLMVG